MPDITPGSYASAPVEELLHAAANGEAGVDRRWLRAIVERPGLDVSAIVQWALAHRDSLIDIDEHLIGIFHHLRAPEAIPFYVAFLRENREEIIDEIFDALYAIRHAALEPLLALYEELGEEQGGEVAFALASFRIRDERVLALLSGRLDYDLSDAALSLGLYGDPAARPALEKALGELSPEDDSLARDITVALSQLGVEDDDEQEPVFDLYGPYPEAAPPPFGLLPNARLAGLLESPSAETRKGAAAALAPRDLSPQLSRKLYEVAKSDPDPAVRGCAWEALTDDEDRNIRRMMLKRIQDEATPDEERAGLIVGLAHQAGEQPVRAIVEELYEKREFRARALKAMWRSFDRTFAGRVLDNLEDEDPEIRRQAIIGVGYLGAGSVTAELVQLMDDDEYRDDALFAYALSADHDVTPRTIHALYERIDDVAGGLTMDEEELVKLALDQRLMLHGREPVYFAEDDAPIEPVRVGPKPGRNDPCPCASGKKYKKCCGESD